MNNTVEAIRERLKRRWLKPGNCLRHSLVAFDLAHAGIEVQVCMGRGGCGLHCWLEVADGDGCMVIDLTRPRGVKFWEKGLYYTLAHIRSRSIKRYSSQEAAERLLQHGLTFWEFPEAAGEVASFNLTK